MASAARSHGRPVTIHAVPIPEQPKSESQPQRHFEVEAGANLSPNMQPPPAAQDDAQCDAFCSLLCHNLLVACKLAPFYLLKPAVAHAAGLAAGAAMRSSLSQSAATAWGPIDMSAPAVATLAAGLAFSFGAAAGLRAGPAIVRRFTHTGPGAPPRQDGRSFGKRAMLATQILSATICGGLPLAGAYVMADHLASAPQPAGPSSSDTANQTNPDARAAFVRNFAESCSASFGREVAQFVRDAVNGVLFNGVIPGFSAFKGGARLSDDVLAGTFDYVRLSLGQAVYTGTTYYHLSRLRDILTDYFGFEAGDTFEQLFSSGISPGASSWINEIVDDLQLLLMTALTATAMGIRLEVKPGEGLRGIWKNLSDMQKTGRWIMDHAAMRIAIFSLGEFLVTEAMTKEGDEKSGLLFLAAAAVALIEWRGNIASVGHRWNRPRSSEEPTPEETQFRQRMGERFASAVNALSGSRAEELFQSVVSRLGPSGGGGQQRSSQDGAPASVAGEQGAALV